MTVYIVEVHFGVRFEIYEDYEDHDKWNYICEVFDSREKAENYISNVDKITEIVKEDIKCERYLGLGQDQPIQIKQLPPLGLPSAYDICAQEEIIADDGNTILGYKEIDWNNVEYWDKLRCHFYIREWEVE